MTVLPRGEKPASREILKESLVVDWSKEALAQAYYSRQSIQLHVFLYIRCVCVIHACIGVCKYVGVLVYRCAHVSLMGMSLPRCCWVPSLITVHFIS